MKTSPNGIDLIKRSEALRLAAYPDPGTKAAPWTIGYGTTVYPNGTRVRRGDTCTTSTALMYLHHDLEQFESTVMRLVKVPLTQNQFDALVSFTYNLGEGPLTNHTIGTLLNRGDYAGAANEITKWTHANGKILKGLVIRRAAEKALFLS